jgi:hypothetical protein
MKIIIFILFVVLFCSSCLNSPQVQPVLSPSSSPETEAQIIKEWSGAGDKTTEPFTITKTPWTIEWEKYPRSEYTSMLLIMVYMPGSDAPVEIFESGSGINYEADTNYIYHTGTFYLDIGAAACDWKIKIVGIP